MEYGPFKPTKNAFLEYGMLLFCHILLFLVVYGLTNYLASTSTSATLFIIYHSLELEIPFIPEWFVIYLSIDVMLWLPLFFVPPHRFRRYFVAQACATLIAGAFFYLFPFDCGFIRTIPAEEPWHSLLNFFYSLDQPHNLVPSLHIGYSTVILLFSREGAKDRWYIFLHVWTLAIYASVLLTHQHHVIDIVTGAALAYFVYKLSNTLCDKWGPRFADPHQQEN